MAKNIALLTRARNRALMRAMKRNREQSLLAAIKVAGTSRKLAKMLGVTPQAVAQWDQIPMRHVLRVEVMMQIPRHEQRPDFYPPPRAGEQGAT